MLPGLGGTAAVRVPLRPVPGCRFCRVRQQSRSIVFCRVPEQGPEMRGEALCAVPKPLGKALPKPPGACQPAVCRQGLRKHSAHSVRTISRILRNRQPCPEVFASPDGCLLFKLSVHVPCFSAGLSEGAADQKCFRICASAPFSSLETCACEIPISSAISVCVLPR